MGEMADYMLEGCYSDEDLYNHFEGQHEKRTCRYCGKRELVWGMDQDTGWRLFNRKGKLHSCKKHTAPITRPVIFKPEE